MNRRTVLKSAAALLGLTAAGGTTVTMRSKTNRYYRGPVSDHFDGVRFFNPQGQAPKGFGDLMRWRFGPKPAAWPERVAVIPARPAPHVDDLTITMVGHATMLIQTGGLNILTDPVWSERASPLRFAGPKRVAEPGIRFEDLPRIDLILLSHNHYDHLDIDTLHRLKAVHDCPVITALGNDALVAPTGLSCTALDWGEDTSFRGLSIHAVPCHHWSARGMGDRSMALWSAFVVTGAAGAILHVGDTGFDDGRPYRGLDRFGPLRAAILPIGAYDPRWFMRDQHQNPDEAVQGFRLCGAAYAVGHHWGTIQLTNEAREAPRDALTEALQRHAIAPERFRALEPGHSWAIPEA